MPGGDRTGPMGAGSMTGWGSGYCGGASYPRGFARGSFGGRQGGFGRGGGRGWRNCFWATGRPGWLRTGGSDEPVAPWTADAERQNLQREAAVLEAELQSLRARIEELETSASD